MGRSKGCKVLNWKKTYIIKHIFTICKMFRYLLLGNVKIFFYLLLGNCFPGD